MEFLGPFLVMVTIVWISWSVQYKLLQHAEKLYTKFTLVAFCLLFFPCAFIYMDNCSGFLCEIGGALIMYAAGVGLLGCLFGFVHFIIKKK